MSNKKKKMWDYDDMDPIEWTNAFRFALGLDPLPEKGKDRSNGACAKKQERPVHNSCAEDTAWGLSDYDCDEELV